MEEKAFMNAYTKCTDGNQIRQELGYFQSNGLNYQKQEFRENGQPQLVTK